MKKLLILTVMLALIVLAGCSAASSTREEVVVPGVPTPPSVVTTPPVPSPAPATPPVFGDGDSGGGVAPSFPGTADQASTADRLIVRTGNMALVVDDINTAIEQISDMTTGFDGDVISSNVFGDKNRLFGSISIRVPAGRFDDAIVGLRALAVEVVSETTNARDVTEEFTDLNSRLKNLEATEQQLLEILKRAVDVEDVLNVQRELTNVRGQIEQTKGRIQFLERTSATSLIDISLQQSKLNLDFNASRTVVKEGEATFFSAQITGGFAPYSYQWDLGDKTTTTEAAFNYVYREDGKYTVTLTVTDDRGNSVTRTRTDYVTVISGWDAGNTVRNAWNGLVNFGRGLATLAIYLGVFIPVWIGIGAIGYGIYRLGRRLGWFKR